MKETDEPAIEVLIYSLRKQEVELIRLYNNLKSQLEKATDYKNASCLGENLMKIARRLMLLHYAIFNAAIIYVTEERDFLINNAICKIENELKDTLLSLHRDRTYQEKNEI